MNRGTTERCWWCNAISSYYETANVLGRHKMRYYCCPTYGFIQTEPPFWLAESYKSPMTSYDLGGSFNSCYAPGYGRWSTVFTVANLYWKKISLLQCGKRRKRLNN